MTANDLNKKQGQSKTLFALIAVAVLAIGAGGFVFLSGKGVNESTEKPAAIAEDAVAAVTDVVDDAVTEVTDAAPAEDAADAETAATDAPVQTPAGEIVQGNPVVATVGGEDITRSDVLGFIAALPEQMRSAPLEPLFPMAQEQVINNKIVSQKAEKQNLESDPEVAKVMEMAKNQIIRNTYVQRELDKVVTEEKLKAEYNTLIKQLPDVEEVKARHVLVETEDAAKALVAKLDEGADFETLARENSTGPTAENGGDLGYFAKGDMIPEFSNVAFALKKGEYSKVPVKTQFGWHVIKVEDKRNRPAPSFEEVRPQVEAKLRQEELGKIIKSWQDDAKVTRFDINGKEIAEDAAPAADKK